MLPIEQSGFPKSPPIAIGRRAEKMLQSSLLLTYCSSDKRLGRCWMTLDNNMSFERPIDQSDMIRSDKGLMANGKSIFGFFCRSFLLLRFWRLLKLKGTGDTIDKVEQLEASRTDLKTIIRLTTTWSRKIL